MLKCSPNQHMNHSVLALVYGTLPHCMWVNILWFSVRHLLGSACVMSMRGREVMGRLVGLVWVTAHSSGDSRLPLSLSISACRHDNGGSCRLPENRLWTLNTSTPRSLHVGNCPTGGSVFSWWTKNLTKLWFQYKFTYKYINKKNYR